MVSGKTVAGDAGCSEKGAEADVDQIGLCAGK